MLSFRPRGNGDCKFLIQFSSAINRVLALNLKQAYQCKKSTEKGEECMTILKWQHVKHVEDTRERYTNENPGKM